MTVYFISDEITIMRKRRIGSTHRYSVSATFTAFKADIQPALPERQESAPGRFGAVYTAFIEASVDIKEGDVVKVTDSGKKYAVQGVEKWQGAGLLDHIELTLVSQDA